MKTRTLSTSLIGAALLVTTSTVAMAQSRTADCERLNVFVAEADGVILDVFANVKNVIRKNDAEECVYYIGRIERAGGITAAAQALNNDTAIASEGFSASDTVSRTIEIEQRAIVEGEVVARIPEPEVAVDVPGAEVAVQETPSEVSVKQQPMTVVVRQPAAKISVRMPKPVITIDQPAPRIFIEMADPEIAVNRTRPRVRVVMPEPTITVTQGEPELAVDVEARLVDPDAVIAETPLRSRAERIGSDGRIVAAGDTTPVAANVGEARVSVVEPQEEDRFTYSRTQPQIRFEGAEPKVAFEYEDAPEIAFRQVGEAVIRFEGPEDADRAAARANRSEMNADQTRAMMLDADDNSAQAAMSNVSLRADDIAGRDVYARSGAYVGDIDRVVSVGDKMYVIVEHGGFLGIGDTEVALPADRIAMDGDDAMLLGMTEAQFDSLPDVDFDGMGRPLVADDAVTIIRVER